MKPDAAINLIFSVQILTQFFEKTRKPGIFGNKSVVDKRNDIPIE